jgi:hypothetical protein
MSNPPDIIELMKELQAQPCECHGNDRLEFVCNRCSSALEHFPLIAQALLDMHEENKELKDQRQKMLDHWHDQGRTMSVEPDSRLGTLRQKLRIAVKALEHYARFSNHGLCSECQDHSQKAKYALSVLRPS